MNKKWIKSILLLIILGGLLYSFSFNISLVKTKTVKVVDLINAFKLDEKKACKTYLNKSIEITGYISEISEAGDYIVISFLKPGEVLLGKKKIIESEKIANIFVQCQLTKDQQSPYNYQVQQKITLKVQLQTFWITKLVKFAALKIFTMSNLKFMILETENFMVELFLQRMQNLKCQI